MHINKNYFLHGMAADSVLWEVTIMELKNGTGKKYKVTRRLPEMSVAETGFFASKESALKQFKEWLN